MTAHTGGIRKGGALPWGRRSRSMALKQLVNHRGRMPGPLAGPRYLSGAECAARLGIRKDTWTSYRTRGYTPEPDVWIGGTPGWLPETIDAWVRPGQGRRTKEQA